MIDKKEKFWYAIYTKPRCERKVHADLTSQGIVSYCPTTKIRKKWTDRYKVIEEPLFKSYVFVQLPKNKFNEVRLTQHVINFVYVEKNSTPAIIVEEDIVKIKRFLKEYENVQVENATFTQNQKVIISSGLFIDQMATIEKVLKNRVVVHIDSLGVNLVAEINIKDVTPF